jgi:hypothetical protein
LVTGADPVPAIRQLAARGARKDIVPLVLDDDQLVALRYGFLRLPVMERQRLGKDVDRAVLLYGRGFGPGGRREDVQVRPADAYLPARLDSADREDSFGTAAGTAIGLTRLLPRCAQVLPRAGTAPGRPGLLPPARCREGTTVPAASATYTLEDCNKPDLMVVVQDIAAQKNGHHNVRTVWDHPTWNPCGETDGFWLWQLKTTANPRPPAAGGATRRGAGCFGLVAGGDGHD